MDKLGIELQGPIDPMKLKPTSIRRRWYFNRDNWYGFIYENSVFQENIKQTNARVDGPFEVLEQVNHDAYKFDLPGDYRLLAAFNIANLSPYLEDDYLSSSRLNSFKQGDDDGDPLS